MSGQTFEHGTDGDGGCCGGMGAGQTLEQMEQALHALWARIQRERAKQAQANEPAKKRGCCCG